MPLTRREFIGATGAAMLSMLSRRAGCGDALGAATAAPAAIVAVNGDRLRRHLEELSVFGRPPGGRFADGVSRLAFSDADVAGRSYVRTLMAAARLQPRIDAAGNIWGRRAGTDDTLPPIVFGSHIDSVPDGGNFDGDLGSLAAIEAVQTLDEHRIQTRHPLLVVVWSNEEGVAFGKAHFGSRAAAGRLQARELEDVWQGVRKADAVRKIGGDPDRIADARIAAPGFHCYIELHIEQGATLDRESIPIGVVDGIVGVDRYEATIRGMANHAGTTAMPDRHDALVAAAHLVLAVNEVVRAEQGPQVGTVGRLEVMPNAPNVIPGLVRHAIELRDLSPAKLAGLGQAVKMRAREIADQTRTEISIELVSHVDPADGSPQVQEAIEGAANDLGLTTRRLPSGAGHDAQEMALLGPMGMIFVPSVDGISHSPRELTTWEHCARGANVLVAAVLRADGMRMPAT